MLGQCGKALHPCWSSVRSCASCRLSFGPYSLLLTLLFTSFVVSLYEDQSGDDHDLHGVNLHGDRDASLHDQHDANLRDDTNLHDDASLHDDVNLHDDANLCGACRQR